MVVIKQPFRSFFQICSSKILSFQNPYKIRNENLEVCIFTKTEFVYRVVFKDLNEKRPNKKNAEQHL